MIKHFLSACFLGLSISVPAATLYVSAEAPQDGNGTQSNPFKKIQAALDIAQPGDTVQLAPGVYRERVHFVKGGEKDRPIRLNGPREAIIDASENTEFKWQPAPEIGPNVYRVPVSQRMDTIVCEEGLVIPLNEERVTVGSPKCSKSVTDHKGIKWIWDWKHNLREGVGELGWGAVKALAMYHKKNGEMLIAFGDGRDPRTSKISMCPREAAVTISGVDYCIVSGITIRHAWFGVLMDGTKNSIVENCRIERGDFGVRIEGKSADCIVRNSEITMDPYCASNPWSKGSWDTWQAQKIGGYWDRIGVDIRNSVGGHKIYDNYIHNHWGGVQDIGEVGENTNLEVHHNRIHDIADDGLEPDGAEENCRWYENIVSDSRCGFRIKCVKKGPLYAYRNLFMHNREDFRNFGTPGLAKATVYVYFNTSTSPVGISTNKVPKEIGNPNYHYFNNIFYCRYPFGQTEGAAEPDWQEGGNVFIRNEDDSRWETSLEKASARNFGKNSLYLTGIQPGFQDFANGNLALTAESPARQAGIDLDKYNLPGLEQYKGIAKPDAGALPFGTETPKLPR